jgi:hypothetical protein
MFKIWYLSESHLLQRVAYSPWQRLRVHHDYSFVIWLILNVSDILRAQSQTARNAILDRAAHDHKTGLVHGERYRAHVVESIAHGASHSEE